MKNRVRQITLATAAALALVPLMFMNTNELAVHASPTFLGTPEKSSQFPQTITQRLGLSNFQDVQLITLNSDDIKSRFGDRAQQLRHGSTVKKTLVRQNADPRNTSLLVFNASNGNVETWIGLPDAGDGPTQINQVLATVGGNSVPITQFGADGRHGFFQLPQGATATVSSTVNNNRLRGVIISFQCTHQCPCGAPGTGIPNCSGDQVGVAGPPQPNGVTAAEATLNVASGQEAADISCVNGVNAKLLMDYDPGQGNTWDDGKGPDGGGALDVRHIENSWVNFAAGQDDNCSRQGVFPYGATDCIRLVGSPVCNNKPPFCVQNKRRCQVQRDPKNGGFGGSVKITYVGPLAPP